MIKNSLRWSGSAGRLARVASRCAASLAVALSFSPAQAAPAKVPAIYFGIGTESSEYWAATVVGAKAVAASVNARLQVMTSEFQGQKFLQDYGAIFAAGCKDCVAILDPVSSAFTKAIVDRATSADAKIITIWNRPDNIHPYDLDPSNWIAHIAFDGVESGYRNGMALCKAIGGSGGVVAIEGVADNPSTKQRFAGLKKAMAECPGMKLLDRQYADWDQTKAQVLTRGWLARYGNTLKAVFSENDSMAIGAIGAIAALKERGLAGKVAVSGSDGSIAALNLIKSGDMVSTMWIDGVMQGAFATALGYGAATGDIDVQKLSHAQRDVYLKQTLVTKENVDDILNRKVDPADYTYEKVKARMWQSVASQIPPAAFK
ncbi:ribose ABC transporter ribose-binding protein (plasmid) [Paraburkholderia sp. PGU19]|uniref:sugar ABC transporter substrate-binding protein n=1 Tax=Paraburkholderia sp. PGU19 TaxID=2735434 RepID=UPI0015DAD949|nr:sugar ABC transporter substrate-binding protein [Paraburkholderia sp. PGU19]BCG04490.1 ribose ABC transporter ribose-binding protein [Paraburkholderia sp. PGU19]